MTSGTWTKANHVRAGICGIGKLSKTHATNAAIVLRTIKNLNRCATTSPMRRRRVTTDLRGAFQIQVEFELDVIDDRQYSGDAGYRQIEIGKIETGLGRTRCLVISDLALDVPGYALGDIADGHVADKLEVNVAGRWQSKWKTGRLHGNERRVRIAVRLQRAAFDKVIALILIALERAQIDSEFRLG